MVTVVAMGYTRQATALGWLMLALNALSDRKLIKYFLLIGLAALFHKTVAILGLLAVARESKRSFLGSIVASGFFTLILVSAVLLESTDQLVQSYVAQEYGSEGGIYRIGLNLIAASLFFSFYARWGTHFHDRLMYTLLSFGSILAAPMLFVSPVGADRMSLYLLPLQVAVYSRLSILASGFFDRRITVFSVVLIYALIHFTWLNFSTHAPLCWVPYNSII
jgi:hypothetical protein